MKHYELPRPNWLEIDPAAIASNVGVLQRAAPSAQVMAVVKANGYGHGAVAVARAALGAGATCCGVAALNEAIELRNAGITAPILVLGYTPAWLAAEAIAHEIHLTLYDADMARACAEVARALGRRLHVHLKLDTGMGRLGALPNDAVAFIQAIAGLPSIKVEGVFTHFSCADSDEAFTRQQWRVFVDVLAAGRVTERWANAVLHAANSAAILSFPDSHFHLVRAGIALYGLNPFDAQSAQGMRWGGQLAPALAWKALVAQVKTLPNGAPVSYGATYRCEGERRIAVVPVGYADGYRRAPRNAGEMLAHGLRAPIRGRVCMDQTMIDVTDIPDAKAGDEVVMIGGQGDQRITAEDVAARLGTVNYEVTSAILPRVPRMIRRG